ncbi:hypothetical protein [Salipaludibacillus sp. CF4.18]|uniref:hypothetical protein n=1 Tax=Salipaludibacillus sp. CF4.18 TaxID=3373081 RepID=UPI003EE627E9
MSKVIKPFTDKCTRKRYPIGSEYEGSSSRTFELHSLGFIEKEVEQEKVFVKENTKKETPKLNHLGSGYYLLPNGEKVRGKKKAIARMESGE